MHVPVLGVAHYPSPLKRWINDTERVPATIVRTAETRQSDDLLFELAGPRGLNDVIRSLFNELHHGYGAKEVLGFRWGYQGLPPRCRPDQPPLKLRRSTVALAKVEGLHYTYHAWRSAGHLVVSGA